MRYSATFLEREYEALQTHLAVSKDEQAAFLICRTVRTETEMRLLVREFVPVTAKDIQEQSPVHMKISPRAYIRAMSLVSYHETVSTGRQIVAMMRSLPASSIRTLFATLPVRATLRPELLSAADCALVCQYPIDRFVQQRATRWTLTLASRLIIRIYP